MSATGKNLLWFYFVGFLTEFRCVLIWWDRVLGGIRISASTAKSVRSEHLMAADVYSFGMICHELDWMDSFQRVPHFRLWFGPSGCLSYQFLCTQWSIDWCGFVWMHIHTADLKWEEDWDRLDVPEFEYYKVYVGGKVLNLSREWHGFWRLGLSYVVVLGGSSGDGVKDLICSCI